MSIKTPDSVVPSSRGAAWIECAAALLHAPWPAAVDHAVRAGAAASIDEEIDIALDRAIAAIDELVGAAVDAVLHAPAFQRLEAAWRGLHYVVERVEFQENAKLAVWACSKDELADDLEGSTELVRTRAFANIYTAEFGQFGGEPYAAILGDFEFDASPRDVNLLRAIAAIAAMAQAPFFAAASPTLLRLGSWRNLPAVQDPSTVFVAPGYATWKAFRQTEDSRYVGLLLPRVLMRVPHEPFVTDTRFSYTERVRADGEGLLWASPTFPFAVRLAASFARYRTLGAIVGDDHDAPFAPIATSFDCLGRAHRKAPLEVSVTPRLERALQDVGLIAFQHRPESPRLFLASANSLQAPQTFGNSAEGREKTLSYLLGTRFQYLLLATRFAHYIKVIERDAVGGHQSADDVQQRLENWLSEYVVDMDSASPAVRAKYPLRQGTIRLEPLAETPGWFRASIHVRPHLRYLGSFFTLSVTSRLERRAEQ